jgi:hypothetical protein
MDMRHRAPSCLSPANGNPKRSALGLGRGRTIVHKRKIIVRIAASADGFIAWPDGSADWLDRPRGEGNFGMSAFYKSIDTILWCRKTCDMALDFRGRLRVNT